MALESAAANAARGAKQHHKATWTFLSNRAHVVVCIARDPSIHLCEIAAAVGLTERAPQRIVSELAEAGYLERARSGRHNRYQVCLERLLGHPLEAEAAFGSVVAAVVRPQE